MILRWRKRILAGCDGQALVCASLFSVAALISSLGNGTLGLLVFFPATLLADRVASWRRQSRTPYSGAVR